MLEGLQAEIDRHPELIGASIKIIIDFLNADGSAETETWLVGETPKAVGKKDLLIGVSVEGKAKIYDLIVTPKDDASKAFALQWDAGEDFDMTDDSTRGIFDIMSTDATITADEAILIKRKGERKKSRAEELFGKKITKEDFE